MTNISGFEYDVFVSYRSSVELDKAVAEELQRQLEKYHVDAQYRCNLATHDGRLKVFRDATDLSATSDLSAALELRLKQSRFLFVVCTRKLKESSYCRQEIAAFAKTHGCERIVFVLVEGEIEEYVSLVDSPRLPLGIDIRKTASNDSVSLLRGRGIPRSSQVLFKLIAPLLGCDSPDELVKRSKARRKREWIRILLALGCVLFLFVIASFAFWQRQVTIETRRLVRSLLESDAVGVQRATNDLSVAQRSLAIEELESEFLGNSDARQKLNAIFGIAKLNGFDRKKLSKKAVKTIRENLFDLPKADFENILNAIQADKGLKLMFLSSLIDWGQELNSKIARARHESRLLGIHEAYREKVRLATLLLWLEIPDAARKLLTVDAVRNPRLRVLFISEFKSWHGDLEDFSKVLEKIEDPGLRAPLLMAAASSMKHLIRSQKNGANIPRLANKWHRELSDAETHSAASWVLLQVEFEREKRWDVRATFRQSKAAPPASNRQWYEHPKSEITFLEIPAGEYVIGDGKNQRTEIIDSFFLADREVTRSVYEQFLKKTSSQEGVKKFDLTASPERWCPANNVSWNDAARFCNWLSKQHGIPREQWCYVSEGNIFRQKPNWMELDGYRLPTEVEWKYASLGGASSRFFTGNDTRGLESYAVTETSHTQWCGFKLPNQYGLFDVYGNVSEWCHDLEFDGTVQQRIALGGSFLAKPQSVNNDKRLLPSSTHASDIGFRPARRAITD